MKRLALLRKHRSTDCPEQDAFEKRTENESVAVGHKSSAWS
jgi:hypothetical protein